MVQASKAAAKEEGSSEEEEDYKDLPPIPENINRLMGDVESATNIDQAISMLSLGKWTGQFSVEGIPFYTITTTTTTPPPLSSFLLLWLLLPQLAYMIVMDHLQASF